MLTSISITGEATYPAAGETLAGLKKVNYIFGHNGCGKTTVSRAIHDPTSRAGYAVSWKDGRSIQCLVYNRDFAEASFGDQMQGIFTLGEDSTRATAEIERLTGEIAALNADLGNLRRNLVGEHGNGGREAELGQVRAALVEACWKSKVDHDAVFLEAFTGLRNKKPEFCNRVISEAANNTAELRSLEDLAVDAATVFQEAATVEEDIEPPSFDAFPGFEVHPILSRQIVGRDDVIVAELISRLGNSDWVKQGVDFLMDADGACPFCQQNAPTDLIADLDAFFDEQYEADLAAIDALAVAHQRAVNGACSRIEEIIAEAHRFLDAAVLEERYKALKTAFELNQERVATKRREPSSAISLEPISELTDAIATLLSSANEASEEYNATIRNLAGAKARLKLEIWRFVVAERRTDLDTYATTTGNIQRAIDGMNNAATSKTERRDQLRRELAAIEETVTSVRPTVESINRILGQYGFSNFRLQVAGNRGDMYQIVRLDGADAAHSLSEGERSFITFLYFYHRIAGSTSSSGTADEKIVVFDDPVSSMDAEVLFVVSALIRKVIADVRQDRGNIRQVFVLTHNIYFHKEVSFDRDRRVNARAFESFWIVRKRGNVSSLHRYDYNPVKTSYELLWDEVRNPDRPNLTIQNTMRRIVENYLTVLGGLKADEIVEKFEGRDSQICASLFSWINDGSHSAHDDVYVAVDENAVQGYLRVFKEVFERTGHGAHYRMMMKIADGEEARTEEAQLTAAGAPAEALAGATARFAAAPPT